MLLTMIFAFISIMLLIKLNELLGTYIGFQKENTVPGAVDDMEQQPLSTEYNKDIPNLEEVKKSFPDFYEHRFIQTVTEVFKCVFDAYANEDTELLKELLTPKMYTAFQMAIDDRISKGEKLSGSVERIVSVEIESVKRDERRILIDVKFITEQTTVLKNASGEVIDGDNEFINTVQEVWTFSRSLDSSKRQWYLSEITYISEK